MLLEFWASWCKPCRENAPFLKTVYKKYQPYGLEIISVANDDTRKELWKSIVTEDSMIWKNVLQNAGTSNDIGKLYAIQPIPAMVLIDIDGKIILRYEGVKNELLTFTLDRITK